VEGALSPAWPSVHRGGDDAELAAGYLISRAEGLLKQCAHQGRRERPLSPRASRALGHLSEHRICRVPEPAVQALFAWADGLPVELRRDVPSPGHVLGLQARGWRCVSLLPESAAHDGAAGFDFLIHDLCHLGKFTDARYHLEQVGYFHALETLLADPRWQEIEASLDATWRDDRDRLGADMNGSAVYLFAVLKMRLKMAARRAHARARGAAPPSSGGLDEAELSTFRELETVLLDALGFRGTIRDAAERISARRDAEDAATVLQAHFAAAGRAVRDRRL